MTHLKTLATVVGLAALLGVNAQAQNKELTVGSSATYRPFAYESPTKEIVGYDVDIIKAVAEKAGLQIKIINTPSTGISVSYTHLDVYKRQAVQHYIGIFSDLSQLKAHQAELDRVAHYDPLTGTPNRRLLVDRLVQAIVRTSRSNLLLAVCYLDLDGFKAINDKYGRATGDRFLLALSLIHI